MKIQNTITQPQLEMLLRLANDMHIDTPGWRYGQSVFNAMQYILPDLAEEIRGNPEVDPFNWPEDHGARWTQWYATVCPDEPREMESLNVGEIHIEEEILDFPKSCDKKGFNIEYIDEERQNCKYCGVDLKGDDYDTCKDCDREVAYTNSFTKKHK